MFSFNLLTVMPVKQLWTEFVRWTEREKEKERETWLLLRGSWRWVTWWNGGGGGLKRLDGAKSEMASPTVTQVYSIPRDPADQLTRPQSTLADTELTERWMNGRMDGWLMSLMLHGYSGSLVSQFLKHEDIWQVYARQGKCCFLIRFQRKIMQAKQVVCHEMLQFGDRNS